MTIPVPIISPVDVRKSIFSDKDFFCPFSKTFGKVLCLPFFNEVDYLPFFSKPALPPPLPNLGRGFLFTYPINRR